MGLFLADGFSLMFADDVVILCQSAAGLNRAILKTVAYFQNINLTVNFESSQIMILIQKVYVLNHSVRYTLPDFLKGFSSGSFYIMLIFTFK